MTVQERRSRTNEEWIEHLSCDGPDQQSAITDLRESLLRAAFFYLRRHSRDLKNADAEEVRALAEDAAQESCVKVLQKLETFRGEARFLTWASKFGVGSALVLMRKRQWRDVSLDALNDGWAEPTVTVISTDGWGHPELAAQREEIWRTITESVATDLTVKQRQVMNYLLIHGMNAEVVAERLGMTPGALYKLTHDARRRFKKALEQRGFSKAEIFDAFANPG